MPAFKLRNNLYALYTTLVLVPTFRIEFEDSPAVNDELSEQNGIKVYVDAATGKRIGNSIRLEARANERYAACRARDSASLSEETIACIRY